MNIAQAKGIICDIDKDFDVQIAMPHHCGCCATVGFVSAGPVVGSA